MELLTDVDRNEKYKLKDLLNGVAPTPLDTEITTYPNQIGGHGVFGNKRKILQSQTKHVVYKALQRFPKGVHEVELYERVFDPNCDDSVLLELRNFIPHYQGLFCEPKTNVNYLCMKDLLCHLNQPSICDIKIGRVTYSSDSSPNKIRLEEAKYAWRKDLGFFITAIRVFDGKRIDLDRTYGRSLNPASVYDHGIRLFLGPDSRRAQFLARLFSARLQQLTEWFEKQRLFAFYASSLLLAYANPDGSPLKSTDSWTESSSSSPTSAVITPVTNAVNSDSTDQLKNNTTDHSTDESIVVSLIDFTRWCELSSDRDDNVLYGLYNLIDLFERAATNPASPTLPVFSDRAFVRG